MCDPMNLSKITTPIVVIIVECLALPILSTVTIRGASRENLQYMDTRWISKLKRGIIYSLHQRNMQNHTHLCKFKTLTFKLEQWKHFESDLLQNYQLSVQRFLWFDDTCELKCVSLISHSPAWCLCFQQWCWTHSGPSSSHWESQRCVSFGGCSLPGYETAPPPKPRGVSVCRERKRRNRRGKIDQKERKDR